MSAVIVNNQDRMKKWMKLHVLELHCGTKLDDPYQLMNDVDDKLREGFFDTKDKTWKDREQPKL